MNARPFLDTNVLIYSLAEDDPRAEVARMLLQRGAVTSVHVLNEFVAAARRKFKMPWKEVQEALANFRILCPDPTSITVSTHETGLKIARRYGYSIYDSLVVAAAMEASCSKLYTEDMRDGQVIENLTICNPFENPSAVL